MKCLLPLAGDGTRFKSYSHLPKYMIEVQGFPMIFHGIKGVNIAPQDIIAIVREDHAKAFEVEDFLRKVLGDGIQIVKVGPTRGAADTVRLGIEGTKLGAQTSICVKDVDCISIPKPGWQKTIKGRGTWVAIFADGKPPETTLTNKSHVRLDEEGKVVEVAEKVRLSPWFIAGYYIFSSVDLFLQGFKNLKTNGELYLSGVMKQVLDQGHEVRTLPIQKYADLGTPEVLKAYENCYHL